MGGFGLLGSVADGVGRLVLKIQHHRGQAHDAAVARIVGVRRACAGGAGFAVALQRIRSGSANIKTPAGAGHIAFVVPVQVAVELVVHVKPVLDQAGCQAQGHAGVVRPLAGLQLKGAATAHVADGRKRTTRRELHAGAKRITHRQAQKRTLRA